MTVLTALRTLALVNIRAIATRPVQLVAIVALAPEHSKYIFALSKNAKIVEHFAFVDVDAGLLVALVGMHETHLTFASERPGVIEAVTVLTQTGIIGTLVNVNARVPITSKSCVTDALQSVETRILEIE